MYYSLHILMFSLLLISCQSTIEKAEIFLEQGDFKRSIHNFNKALDEEPESLEARLGLGKSLLQKAMYLNENNRDREEDWENTVHELNIIHQQLNNNETKELLSYSLLFLSKKIIGRGDTLLGIKKLEKLLEQDFNHVEARNYKAIIHHDLGDFQTAIDLFLENTVIDSLSSSASFNLGMLYWQDEDYLTAYEWWIKAFEISPQDKETAYWMLQAEKKLK